jgi:hypothetical protein
MGVGKTKRARIDPQLVPAVVGDRQVESGDELDDGHDTIQRAVTGTLMDVNTPPEPLMC